MNFETINRVMKKFERKKTKTKTIWKTINELTRVKQVKLKRFRSQKKFLREKKQKMFDNDLSNVKKFQRLKNLKKITKIKKKFLFVDFFNDFIDLKNLNSKILF